MTADKSRPSRVRWHDVTCPICGHTVRLTGREYNYRDLQTCGKPDCTKALRLRRDPVGAKVERLAAAADVRRAAHAASLLAGPYETNASAKRWHLLSPDGRAYHFDNLALWLRDHANLFDPGDVTPFAQSRSGVTTRAQAQLGRLRPERRARRQSWKGWTWIDAEAEIDPAH